MSDVVSLGAARAAKETYADRVSVRDVLLGVIEAIDRGELNPTHLLILSATTDENLGTKLRINHAGLFDRFGQIGMLHAATAMIAEPLT